MFSQELLDGVNTLGIGFGMGAFFGAFVCGVALSFFCMIKGSLDLFFLIKKKKPTATESKKGNDQ